MTSATFPIQTVDRTTGKDTVRVHAISTGMVSVKTRFRETRLRGLFAALSFLTDREFTEWMPIWTFVIEHPEGTFLVDTGENSRVNDKDYFKASGRFENWLNTTQFRFLVNREDEIDRQLLKIGLRPEDIGTVILTHLHLDHIDGLRHFPHARILVGRQEWDRPYGDLPKLYPDWFDPERVELDATYGHFPGCAFLTERKDLLLVHTPGHTHGHCAVLLKTGEGHILFGGDVSYFERQLAEDRFAGANADPRKARETYATIKRFAMDHKTVYLPSHDPAAAERLVQMRPL